MKKDYETQEFTVNSSPYAVQIYERLGFRRDGDVRPDYRYFGHLTGDVRRPKESFQLRRFRDDPALVWEDGWTEARAARENGLSRVWDAGKVRWVLDVA